MKPKTLTTILALACIPFFMAVNCQKPANGDMPPPPPPPPSGTSLLPKLPPAPFNYASLESEIPPYILNYLRAHPEMDNTPTNNPITNEGATLGRVLFYDKLLSVNNKISCASCHHQDKAFTDAKAFSAGFEDKVTRRSSMSPVNLR